MKGVFVENKTGTRFLFAGRLAVDFGGAVFGSSAEFLYKTAFGPYNVDRFYSDYMASAGVSLADLVVINFSLIHFGKFKKSYTEMVSHAFGFDVAEMGTPVEEDEFDCCSILSIEHQRSLFDLDGFNDYLKKHLVLGKRYEFKVVYNQLGVVDDFFTINWMAFENCNFSVFNYIKCMKGIK